MRLSLGPALCIMVMVLPIFSGTSCKTAPESAAPITNTELSGVVPLPPPDTNSTRLLIDKSERQLYLYQAGRLLKRYPVVLGFDPVRDKHMEGDGCTPEGTFGVRSKYPHAKWSKFIWIDYPNAESWSRFNARKSVGKVPSDAGIGGDIGIHGVPEGMDYLISKGQNWTLGCISLSRPDIDELYAYVGLKTEIEIRP